jgi:hypothetical protein
MSNCTELVVFHLRMMSGFTSAFHIR